MALTRPVAADTHDDRPKPVEHVGGAIRLGRDDGVQADEGITEVVLDERFLGLAGEVLVGKVVPTETGELARAASEPGADGGVMRDAAAKYVADEGFDGVGFVEVHTEASAWLGKADQSS